MDILILEDNFDKTEDILKLIDNIKLDTKITTITNYNDFVKNIYSHKYDLVVADLIVPAFSDSSDEQDVTDRLIQDIRSVDCVNFDTPVIAVTQYDEIAETHFKDLNIYNITVITYEKDKDNWKEAFKRKFDSAVPKDKYAFVIVCALEKEAEAYSQAGYNVGELFSMHGLSSRTIDIDNLKGLIVTLPRMGLVNAAIVCSRVIELYEPRLICMSGICAGIDGNASIYDVIIPEICHQHDSGKWTPEGFLPESYSVQLQHNTKLELDHIIKGDGFLKTLKQDINPTKSEFASDKNEFVCKVYLAPTSSGSSVIADNEMLNKIKEQHRKMTAFEMESYALYETARQSLINPIYFSVKSVVDNGNDKKSDDYHRVGCILSAKAVYQIIAVANASKKFQL